jgi:hypothetical protein
MHHDMLFYEIFLYFFDQELRWKKILTLTDIQLLVLLAIVEIRFFSFAVHDGVKDGHKVANRATSQISDPFLTHHIPILSSTNGRRALSASHSVPPANQECAQTLEP